jgi:hypothetical protein
MFCAPGLFFGGNVGVVSRFHVLRTRNCFRRYRRRQVPFSCFRFRTRFRRCRGRRVPLSCFALPNSFSAVPRASCPVFMFYAPVLIFTGTKVVGSRFHVLRSRTRFRQCGGRRVLFSCFALPDSFSAVTRASGPVFMFCAPGLVFGGTEGVGSRIHFLRARTRFWRYRRRPLSFSCFSLPDTFSAVRRASGPGFMFCALGLIFGGSESVKSCFHVLRPRTRFWRYRGRQVPFSCCALPDSFLAVQRA